MRSMTDILGKPRALIGMVHVGAIPGTPRAAASLDQLISGAVADAKSLAGAGFDAIILENMHDRPYVHAEHGPETTAIMTRVGLAIRDAARSTPLGIQVLSGGNREALAIALAIGGSFIRCENFVFSHVADEGLLPRAEAGGLLRYRRSIGAESIAIFADIKKKHASHAITADLSIAEAAEAAAFFLADGVIVTGTATGKPTDPADLAAVRRAVKLPLLVGSGAAPEQLPSLFSHADGVIVGSWIKRDGSWENPVDPARAAAMASVFRSMK